MLNYRTHGENLLFLLRRLWGVVSSMHEISGNGSKFTFIQKNFPSIVMGHTTPLSLTMKTSEEIFSSTSQKLQRRGTYVPKISWIMWQHPRSSKSLVRKLVGSMYEQHGDGYIN